VPYVAGRSTTHIIEAALAVGGASHAS
jgi:hypothetical protein